MTLETQFFSLNSSFMSPHLNHKQIIIEVSWCTAPERGENAVSDEDAEAVNQCQLQADVLKVIVCSRQQVPGHQLLRREPLGDLN